MSLTSSHYQSKKIIKENDFWRKEKRMAKYFKHTELRTTIERERGKGISTNGFQWLYYMTLTLNPECGRAAMRRICASLPRQRTAAGDTPGHPIVRIFCHILPFIFLSLIAFFDNLNEYKKRMNDNNKQPNSLGGDNMDFRPIRTRLVASSPSFLLSFHSAATTLVKAFRCVCVCCIELPMLSAGIASPVEQISPRVQKKKRCSSSISIYPLWWADPVFHKSIRRFHPS